MKLTNQQYAQQNEVFKEACFLASCEPTKRQASKFRLGVGSAYKYRKEAVILVEQRKKETRDA
jgi:hypothetical protein